MEAEAARAGRLRDRLKARLEIELEGVTVNGSMEHRLPGNLNVSFDGVDARDAADEPAGVALSTGSACTSATVEPSHVLRALGLCGRPRALIGALRPGPLQHRRRGGLRGGPGGRSGAQIAGAFTACYNP